VTPVSHLILICAFTILLIGLCVFYWARRSAEMFYVTNLIAWLLMALFPVLLLFSIFPNPGSVEVKLFGTSATGAVALFIFIWVYGNRSATKNVAIDRLTESIRQLEAKLQELKTLPHAEGGTNKPIVLTHTEKHVYQLKAVKSRRIVVITGNIENIRGIDAWVSSENTNMQMARFYDRSVSGTVRYLGARKDSLGRVTDDSIAKELAAQMGEANYVEPATVVVTGSGELERSNGVKRIFHVASVSGQVASGYRPIDNIGQCVIRALQRANSEEFAKLNIRSMLFPLLGSGTAKGELDKTVEKLLAAALQYLATAGQGGVEEVYFLSWTDTELASCRHFLNNSDKVIAVSGAGR
jgi:hypothetical protein